MLLVAVPTNSKRMISRSKQDQSRNEKRKETLTITRQHWTSGHCSIHRFNIADAEDVAPRRRNHLAHPCRQSVYPDMEDGLTGENPSEERAWMIRRCCGR